jgi:ribosomal protein S25
VTDGISRRGVIDEDIVLGVLDVIERDRNVTQRRMASELGIALGLANAYLKRCARKGFIKVSNVPTRRYAYYLTPQGFAEKSRLTARYLAHSFAFFGTARSQCEAIFVAAAASGQKRLLLIGKGELSEIASLVARDHAVEIVGTVAEVTDVETLRSEIEHRAPVHAVVIAAMSDARETFDAAIEIVGEDRVHAPALLRLHRDRALAPGGDQFRETQA